MDPDSIYQKHTETIWGWPKFKQDSEPVEKVFLSNSWDFKIIKNQ